MIEARADSSAPPSLPSKEFRRDHRRDHHSDGLPLAYWLVQLAALAGGLLLLWLGGTLRPRNQHTR